MENLIKKNGWQDKDIGTELIAHVIKNKFKKDMEVINMAYDVEKIKSDLISEKDEYEKLIKKVQSRVTKMTSEEAISHGFVPGARLVKNKVLDKINGISIPENVENMNEFEFGEKLYNMAKGLNEAVDNICYVCFCMPLGVSGSHCLKVMEGVVNGWNDKESSEKDKYSWFNNFMHDAKDAREIISEIFGNATGDYKDTLEANEQMRSEIENSMYKAFYVAAEKLKAAGKNVSLLKKEDIYKDSLNLGDGFSIENGVKNLLDYYDKLYTAKFGKSPEFSSELKDRMKYFDSLKDKDIDMNKLTENRMGLFGCVEDNYLVEPDENFPELLLGCKEAKGEGLVRNSIYVVMALIEEKFEAMDGFDFLGEKRREFEKEYKKLKELDEIAKANFEYIVDTSDLILKTLKEKYTDLYNKEKEYFESLKKRCSKDLDGVNSNKLDEILRDESNNAEFWAGVAGNIVSTAENFIEDEEAKPAEKEKAKEENKQVVPAAQPAEEAKPAEKEKPVEQKGEAKKEEKAEVKPAVMGEEIDWNEFKEALGDARLRELNDLKNKYNSWKIRADKDKDLKNTMAELDKNSDSIYDFVLLLNANIGALASTMKSDKKIEAVNKSSSNKYIQLSKAMENYFGASKKEDETGKKLYWELIKKIINDRLNTLERLLVAKTQTEEEKRLSEKGFLGKAVDFVKDGWKAITGAPEAPVKLTLDSTMAEKFKTMSFGVSDLCRKQFVAKDLRSLFKQVFQDRKSTYKSWYNYVDGIVCDMDKCIKKYSNIDTKKDSEKYEIEGVKSAVQISLMYVFLRSMVHCDLKDVNTIREGIKRFVSAIDENISSKKDVNEVEGTIKTPVEVMKAGAKTRQICKDVKTSMNEVLNHKKNLRDEVLNKDQCKMILEFIPSEYKSKLKKRIVK